MCAEKWSLCPNRGTSRSYRLCAILFFPWLAFHCGFYSCFVNLHRPFIYIKVAPADFATLLKEQWRLKPDALSAEQTAQLLGYTTTTVAKWIKAGKLNAIPYQRGYMIPKEWLMRYLADTVNDNRATKSEKHMRLIRECQKN